MAKITVSIGEAVSRRVLKRGAEFLNSHPAPHQRKLDVLRRLASDEDRQDHWIWNALLSSLTLPEGLADG